MALFSRKSATPVAPITSYGSPWADPNNLALVEVPSWMNEESVPVTRELAMKVPAFARARTLLASNIARCPLIQVKNGETSVTPELWLTDAGPGSTPYHRMLWTIDDLITIGRSLWKITRENGSPIRAEWWPPALWSIDSHTRQIMIADRTDEEMRVAAPGEVALIIGPHEGVLNFAQTTIRQANSLNRTATERSMTPTPVVVLKNTSDSQLTSNEIKTLIETWQKARRGENGGIAYTNKSIEAIPFGEVAGELLIESRNAASVDIARVVGLPATMIDATNVKASLTYETTAGRNAEFIDYSVSAYIDPIAARLSLDDLCPTDHSIIFDTTVLRENSATIQQALND